MGIPVNLILIAVGAILAFAVHQAPGEESRAVRARAGVVPRMGVKEDRDRRERFGIGFNLLDDHTRPQRREGRRGSGLQG
jgi:hypothetical protein